MPRGLPGVGWAVLEIDRCTTRGERLHDSVYVFIILFPPFDGYENDKIELSIYSASMQMTSNCKK